MTSVLIIASTRAHLDTQEILRIQDTASALLDLDCAVDLLVPHLSPLLSVALSPQVHIFTAPHVPFCGNPPERPSFRRFLTGVSLFLYAVSLISRRAYTAFHGFNDGVLVMRALSGMTFHRHPCVAEIHTPFSTPGFFKGPRAAIARHFERRALKQADAIVLPDEDTLALFGKHIPRARVSLIPDPHAELTPDEFTFGDFNVALRHIYDYVLRPRKG